MLFRIVIPLAVLICFPAGFVRAEPLVRRDISVAGENRRAYLHFPNGVQRPSLPAVIVFHGGGGNAAGMIQMTGMNETADAGGFIAVYPEGNPASRWLGARFETWNGGRCCGTASAENKDDIGFVAALIDELVREYKVDPGRIYATGISNGAQMAYRVACELSDRVAAIAPVASVGMFDPCRPRRHIPILHIHGTADPCARYTGGTCGGCFGKVMKNSTGSGNAGGTWPCASVPEYISRWRSLNACRSAETEVYRRGAASCASVSCGSGSEVTLCTIKDGGHTWPGGASPVRGCDTRPKQARCVNYDAVVGVTSSDLDASRLIWEFFSRHRLRTGGHPDN